MSRWANVRSCGVELGARAATAEMAAIPAAIPADSAGAAGAASPVEAALAVP
ncbi:hypothetical protein MGAST_08490 [Mycobacterium gastri 'Wayne']|nr:hypothetical protein MGAST_08490 [Mycobacterium gastri 'Wayne']